MPAVAVTDMSKPVWLIGSSTSRARRRHQTGSSAWKSGCDGGDDPVRLVLLCQDLTGYRHPDPAGQPWLSRRPAARRTDDRLPLAGR